jgi:hypothetical protein
MCESCVGARFLFTPFAVPVGGPSPRSAPAAVSHTRKRIHRGVWGVVDDTATTTVYIVEPSGDSAPVGCDCLSNSADCLCFLWTLRTEQRAFHAGVYICKRMTEKETVSVRLEEDVIAEVEDYAELRGISRSDAVRRLLRRGALEGDRLGRIDRRVEAIEERVSAPIWRRIL